MQAERCQAFPRGCRGPLSNAALFSDIVQIQRSHHTRVARKCAAQPPPIGPPPDRGDAGYFSQAL